MTFKQKLVTPLLTLLIVLASLFAFTLPAGAQRYDCGTYGADAFGTAQECEDGSIADTGGPLVFILPAFLVIGGVVILYRLNRKKPPKDK